MGSRVYPNPKCWHLGTPYSLDHSQSAIPPSLRNVTDSDRDVPYRLVFRSAFRGSRNLRLRRVKRACSAHFDDYQRDEMMNLIQEVAKKLDLAEEEEEDANPKEISYAVSQNAQNRQAKYFSDRGSSEQFRTVKPDFLVPSLLGIQPEPPSWPERDEILRLSFERKVNSVEIPISIRMIKKKLQWQKGFEAASELTTCSVKRTFSSILFIIHKLQNYALQVRERLYGEDLQGVMAKLQQEMDASFVWLFQQVFWKTPSLMVYVMVLLANFSVFSMSNSNTTVLSLADNKNKLQYAQVDQDEHRNKELTEDEEELWNSMQDESSRWQKELRTEALDNETMRRFVAPVSVELEGDQYEEYVKTKLYYRRHLGQAPYNSLLLSNYAQFLCLVAHDHDGAEEYFKQSVLVQPPDAEALSRYADFLWLVRKDLWAAELRYQQALEADPSNNYYASKYASFLWSTGGKDTCFPLEFSDNLQL